MLYHIVHFPTIFATGSKPGRRTIVMLTPRDDILFQERHTLFFHCISMPVYMSLKRAINPVARKPLFGTADSILFFERSNQTFNLK